MDINNFKNNKKLKIQVITLSDRASKGEYSDLSGPEIADSVIKYFDNKNWQFDIETEIIPDNAILLENKLLRAKNTKVDIVFTTGGTGIGPRDFTPEVMKKVIEKEIPGIMENIRIKYGQNIPNALLSRGTAGVTGETQIYSLPGSLKAVKEYMTEILKTLEHLIFMLHGVDVHQKHK
ncbi:MAG: MogA/MoaB family molybdenum cofactor biosynthesis protein [Bacteroidales bacterium]|nr:MogA/MoaB family molybdenum cofactor biosynthesis protein [Bacteroidales bacterium]MBN2758347.1 MogA/MoaB family molybdenum cofactor biosynthesis protein [Bacteroidales bacterium]